MQHSFCTITCFNLPSLSGQVFCRDGNVHSAGSEGVTPNKHCCWALAGGRTTKDLKSHLIVLFDCIKHRLPTPLFQALANPVFSYCHTVLLLPLLCYCDSCMTTALQQYFSIFCTWTVFLEQTHKKYTPFPSSFLQQTNFLDIISKKPTVLI